MSSGFEDRSRGPRHEIVLREPNRPSKLLARTEDLTSATAVACDLTMSG